MQARSKVFKRTKQKKKIYCRRQADNRNSGQGKMLTKIRQVVAAFRYPRRMRRTQRTENSFNCRNTRRRHKTFFLLLPSRKIFHVCPQQQRGYYFRNKAFIFFSFKQTPRSLKQTIHIFQLGLCSSKKKKLLGTQTERAQILSFFN